MDKKSCLVIIDVQKGFINEKTIKVVGPIVGLAKSGDFNFVVGTKFTNHPKSVFSKMLGWDGLISPEEQALCPEIEEVCDKVFEKSIYSCFTTDFIEFVLSEEIDQLVFVGVDLDCCVLASALDCFELGMDFEIAVDCCASNGGTKSESAALGVLQRCIGGKRLKHREGSLESVN